MNDYMLTTRFTTTALSFKICTKVYFQVTLELTVSVIRTLWSILLRKTIYQVNVQA